MHICLCSDFFYPSVGGVESHILNLALELHNLGHFVFVITHKNKFKGVKFLGPIKVYYLTTWVFFRNATFPTIFSQVSRILGILKYNKTEIVHGHQSYSALAMETILHARALGIPCFFTDHSLTSINEAGSIFLNKANRFYLNEVNKCICVSSIQKENLHIRCKIPLEKIIVIPNGVDSNKFKPHFVNDFVVVVVSRLVYLKGADLLALTIPLVCELDSRIKFIIAGSGDKKILLEQMREKNNLQSRVEMLGMVPHSDVHLVLKRGTIFLNASLTEAFCIAILEAASMGLHVVSTRVGGVPELLPDSMITYSDTNPQELCDAILKSMKFVEQNLIDPQKNHEFVLKNYSWKDMALKTEKVYKETTKTDFLTRFRIQSNTGFVSGILFSFTICIHQLLVFLLE